MITLQKQNNLDVERTSVGLKRALIQIKATIIFEFKRNLKNLVTMLVIAAIVYLLSLTINLIQQGRGAEKPEDPVDYIKSYLILIDFLIMIIATTFGGAIIAEDYNNQTGNLIFPKITKERLLTGRLISRYIYSATSVIFFYILVGITTLIEYGELPSKIWISMLWALLYTLLVLAFVTFFSSWLKSTNATVITSILFILIVFNLTNSILMFTGVEIEPLFILTYYSSIITSCFSMPETRYVEQTIGPRQAADAPTYMSWITPSVTGALIGMLIYTTVLLVFAYILFRKRQQKQS